MNHLKCETSCQFSVTRQGNVISKQVVTNMARRNAVDYESNQQDATIQVNLLFLVSSTCFGRCLPSSSGALDCIYSIW
jgi:hypothetical protein